MRLIMEQCTKRKLYLYTTLPADWNGYHHWLIASYEVSVVAFALKRSLDLTAFLVRRALELRSWLLCYDVEHEFRGLLP